MPNWVFSPLFSLQALEKWVGRQVDVFEKAGVKLSQIRIKNPGQGKDWTADTLWKHVQVMRSVFKARGLEEPIVYIHNHDFNGLGGHIQAELLGKAHAEGYNNLVIDAAYRKNGTHNDNTVVLAALKLTGEQREALLEYNHQQQLIEGILGRFDSRTSQMTPWDSDWAGGTEGSDIRICKEYDIDPRLINHAKEVASEVFPLERAVTPFSEYKLRIGIGIMVEDAIKPKTAAKVREFVEDGGKLKIGGDVLVGLKRWETLVAKPPIVDKLLDNMQGELDSAMGALSKLVGPNDLPADFTASQRHTALGYQAKGVEFVKNQKLGKDLTPLLVAPHVLHAKPRTLTAGTKFEVLTDANNVTEKTQVEFQGFGMAPNGDVTLSYLMEGQTITVALNDPDRAAGAAVKSGPRKATPGDPNHLPTIIPGELLSYAVKPGDLLTEGEPLCVLESMKMEMKISVPENLDGKKVKSLPCNGRTKELQGDILAPGDLLLEVEDGPSMLDLAAGSIAGAKL
jgi:biotin carboxyl carrier protein